VYTNEDMIVVCCIVYHICGHSHEQFLQVSQAKFVSP